MSYLVVIYGPPLAGKTAFAWELARSLPGKTAVVSADHLLSGSIAVPDPDEEAELELVHVQLRLLVAQYLKNRYHVIVEGPFLYEREGRLHSFEADIDQLVALMRNLASTSLVVRLDASATTLTERAAATGRENELAISLKIADAYKARYGSRLLSLDSGEMTLEAMVAEARRNLVPELT
jgi:hypothetical protein